MEIPIDPKLLLLIGKILVITQALKRIFDIPWIAKLLEKILKIDGFAGGASMVLAAAVGLVAGVLQYGSDGALTMDEVWLIVQAVIGAIGGFSLAKVAIGGVNGSPVNPPAGK
jgi:hypothetical protein